MRKVREIRFPEDYKFKLTRIFGDTPRIRIIEMFLYFYSNSGKVLITYISQIARVLNLSKSSVKTAVDRLIEDGILSENKIETHAKYPKRNLFLNINHPAVIPLVSFYSSI